VQGREAEAVCRRNKVSTGGSRGLMMSEAGHRVQASCLQPLRTAVFTTAPTPDANNATNTHAHMLPPLLYPMCLLHRSCTHTHAPSTPTGPTHRC
jgi:hypothetical protein